VIYVVISVSLLESRRHSILHAGRRVIWQKQETGEVDWPVTFYHPDSSKPHTKKVEIPVPKWAIMKVRNPSYRGSEKHQDSTVRLFGVFCLVYCYIAEKCLKFAGTFPWKFKITGRLLIAPM